MYDNPLGKPHDEMVSDVYPMTRYQFMRIMGFDEDTVRANEQGFVTQAQRNILKRELKDESDAMWLMFTVFMGVAVLLALIVQAQGIPMMNLVVAGGLFFGGFLFLTYRRQSNITGDTKIRKPEQARGAMQLEFGGLGEDRRYWLRVGEERFRLSMQVFRELGEHSHNGYLGVGRIFYAPQSRMILGGELYDHDDYEKRKNDDPDFAEDVTGHKYLSDDEWRGWDDFDALDDEKQKRHA